MSAGMAVSWMSEKLHSRHMNTEYEMKMIHLFRNMQTGIPV